MFIYFVKSKRTCFFWKLNNILKLLLGLIICYLPNS